MVYRWRCDRFLPIIEIISIVNIVLCWSMDTIPPLPIDLGDRSQFDGSLNDHSLMTIKMNTYMASHLSIGSRYIRILDSKDFHEICLWTVVLEMYDGDTSMCFVHRDGQSLQGYPGIALILWFIFKYASLKTKTKIWYHNLKISFRLCRQTKYLPEYGFFLNIKFCKNRIRLDS